MRCTFLVSLLAVLTTAALLSAQDPFASQIRPSDPLSPEEQLKTFRLPPGFEIQLVACEPEILKPLNMAFDAKGRLWITETIEYPYAAPRNRKGRDNIKILADTNGDGRAEKITTFADGLNIPIGIYPYNEGAIAFSIPYIWKFLDKDGDDVVDERIKLYGPMGFERDTHGLNNAFRRGFDGWVYACHGFNNETRVKGTDGHEIRMQSGNTYRFRLDGTRIEHFTHGQVNPFGMTFDPLGNLFTADCHSKPIYQLLRDGYYPSFGKPDDGLGFVPPMMDHTHGSTAISGIAFYTGENFPEKFRGSVFTGNVMTSRVNHNSLEFHGSTIIAKEQPDFLVSSDPWFRPVDIQVGPDGALYIADFYNRIIGHYEVPLDHPGRDRHRGRIWRVSYSGDAQETKPARMPESIANASARTLVDKLADSNLGWRTIATDQLVDRYGTGLGGSGYAEKAFRESTSAEMRAHALWVLHRKNSCSDEILKTAASDSDRLVRTHSMKLLSERESWSKSDRTLAWAALQDKDAFVRRAAADAMGQSPHLDHISPLVDALAQVSKKDVMLRHTIRMALRNHYSIEGVAGELEKTDWTPEQANELASAALASRRHTFPGKHDEGGDFILHYLGKYKQTEKQQLRAFLLRARYRMNSQLATAIAKQVQTQFGDDLDFQYDVLERIHDGLHVQKESWPDELVSWGRKVAFDSLASVEKGFDGWMNVPIPHKMQSNPWCIRPRSSADGDTKSLFLTTLPTGEVATGVLRSNTFKMPKSLSFFVAGHIGHPQQPVSERNFVRLRDAKSHKILAESTPPRNDIAQHVEWDIGKHEGHNGYLEIVDGDSRSAYAWLAVGRFDPPVVAMPKMDGPQFVKRHKQAIGIAHLIGMKDFESRLVDWVLSDAVDREIRAQAANTLCSLKGSPVHVLVMSGLIADPTVSNEIREKICRIVVDPKPDAAASLLAEALRASPQHIQNDLAKKLLQFPGGGERLLRLVKNGHASTRLLQDRNILAQIEFLKTEDHKARIKALTADLPPHSEELRRLVETRRKQFVSRSPSLERGADMYAKKCAVCHQLKGKGPLIGPQLDGIGNRGSDRIIEDILDPNRNVDVAFRSTTMVTTEGKVLTGLFRREQGESLVFVDNQGKEFSVPKAEIDEQNKTAISLMPENLVQSITEQEFYDLVSYLLTIR